MLAPTARRARGRSTPVYLAARSSTPTGGCVVTLPIAPGTYGIDTNHSQLGFSVRHLGISLIRGTFDRYAGALYVGDDLSSTVVVVEAEMDSLNSGNRDRDLHMHGPEWFD